MAHALELEVLAEPRITSAGWFTSVRRAVRKNPVGAIAGVFCLVLVFLAILGPQVAPYSANRIDFARLEAPSLSHPFGTDNLFRDIFSRIIVGSRNSMGIGFAAIAVSTSFGIMLGITSGYFGGPFDLVVSRFIDIMIAYPPLVLVIFLVAVFGSAFTTVAIAIGLILTPQVTRIVRSSTIGVRHLQYMEAATALGAGHLRIMARHILPNIAAPIIVIATVNIGLAILIEAALSFLGLGVSSAANPSWGRMLQETRPAWQQAWWTMIFPGFAISIAVLSFNVFGDALRDWLDPRLRGSR